jgi:nicotinamidase-related amidase
MNKKIMPALILIDIQKGFDHWDFWGGQRNNLQAEKNMQTILAYWRQQNAPVFHVKHCSVNPKSLLAEGQPGNDFKDMVLPLANEPVIKKQVNSAFIGTSLKKQLEQKGIKSLVVIGLTTDHCVSTTARMAGNFGFETFVISDATATFNKTGYNGQFFDAELIHQTALASLHNEFASVLTTQSFLEQIRLYS